MVQERKKSSSDQAVDVIVVEYFNDPDEIWRLAAARLLDQPRVEGWRPAEQCLDSSILQTLGPAQAEVSFDQ